MKILQNVSVKQILTENSKRDLEEKYNKDKFQLQKESEQLRFEFKKLERSKKFSSPNLQRKFSDEFELRQEKIKLIDMQIEQLQKLPLGSELQLTECQAIVEVNIGDRWDNSITNKTIVVRDGIIVEIR